MNMNNNKSVPSFEATPISPTSSRFRNNKASSIFERRPSTSDKPLLSLSTAPPRAKSPGKRLTPTSATPTTASSLLARMDSLSKSQNQKSISGLPQFLKLPSLQLHRKFALLREHEQTIRTMPNTMMQHPIVLSRNRYSDVYPWQHHRVSLASLEHDYINASPISLRSAGQGNGEVQENYIATQGPRDNGFDGGLFWEMCWQEKVKVVVMLTRPVEKGIEKCGVYYPEMVGEVKRIGDWEATCIGRGDEKGTTRRTLQLRRVPRSPATNIAGSENGQEEQTNEVEQEAQNSEVVAPGETRIIHHFLFQNWPDNDIPQSPEDVQSLLTLLDVSRAANDHSTNPRIIHCSAGVGRTGTFIALDHLSRELEYGQLDNLGKDNDPIFETVKRLREQRMLMVHRVSQYLMIYNVLKEKWGEREATRSNRHAFEGNRDERPRLPLTPSKTRSSEKGDEAETPTSSARKRKLIGDDNERGGLQKVAHT